MKKPSEGTLSMDNTDNNILINKIVRLLNNMKTRELKEVLFYLASKQADAAAEQLPPADDVFINNRFGRVE